MDNQNTNGVNGNNLEQMNNPVPNENPVNNGVVPPVVPNNTEESSSTPTLESIIVEPTPTVEPVKPTLDSILNGNPVEPTVDTLEPVSSSSTTNIEKEAPVAPDATNSETAPMTGFPNDAVVDTSASVAPTIETIPENVVNETPVVENTIVEEKTPTTEEPTVVDLNPTLEETVIEPTNEQVSSESSVDTLEVPIDNTENVNSTAIKEETNQETPIDDFNAVPVPPVFEEEGKSKKKKEGNKKTFIILLLLLLVAAIGFGVYYFLSIAKKSTAVKISTKEVKVELGSLLSTNIDDYATISGYDKTNCTLDLDDINMNKVSTYKYKITCGKVSEEGNVMVDDTTKPEVITTDLTLLPNSTIKAKDFIEECLDASKCSYAFKTDVTNLTNTVGEYNVDILVSDEYNNQNTVTAKLIVSKTAPARYLTCKKSEENIEDITATLVDSYKIGIDASDNFYNAVRTSEFKFKDKDKYTTVVNSYNEAVGIHDRIGNATFNENGLKIIIKGNKTLEDMNKELNGRLPNNSNILRAFLSGLGYTCN